MAINRYGADLEGFPAGRRTQGKGTADSGLVATLASLNAGALILSLRFNRKARRDEFTLSAAPWRYADSQGSIVRDPLQVPAVILSGDLSDPLQEVRAMREALEAIERVCKRRPRPTPIVRRIAALAARGLGKPSPEGPEQAPSVKPAPVARRAADPDGGGGAG